MIARLAVIPFFLIASNVLVAQNAPAPLSSFKATKFSSAPAPRQQRSGKTPRPASLIADSIAVAGDSNAAMVFLDSVLRKNPKDFAALNEKGRLAWSMGRGTRRDAVQPLSAIKLLMQADTALRMATIYAPDSARYWIDLTRFALNSGNTFIRARAEPYMSKAVRAAEKMKDSVLVAEASDELGMMWWRRYEASANKGFIDGIGDLLDRGSKLSTNDPGKARPWTLRNPSDHIDQLVKIVTPPTGDADYAFALTNLHRARFANPRNTVARGHYYMALAEKKQWVELLSDAALETKHAPWDFEAQLALGLAEARLDRPNEAAAAFDSAFAYMNPAARESFTRISRILPPEVHDSSGTFRVDAGRYKLQTAAENSATSELYWTLADPLYKTKVNENRIEFYARVAYSDVRWSSADFDLRGSDSDRGDIYVRFGPPDRQALITYQPPSQIISMDGMMSPQLAEVKMLIWVYNSGKVFYFEAPPTYGLARIPHDDKAAVAEILDNEPVRWDNVAATSSLDTMTARQVRFRIGRDSMDVVTAVAIPAARMLKGTEIGGALPFDISVREYDKQVRLTYADSLSTKLNADSVPDLINRSWVRRLGPEPTVMRIDAFQSDTRRAARGLVMNDETRPSGFGMSDILFGQALKENPTDVKRWSDVRMVPTVGFFHLKDPVGMVWELYDFAVNKDGQSQYKIDFDVLFVREPGFKELVKLFTVKALGRLSDAVTNTARATESVTFSFDRTQRGDATLTDYVTLAFANVQPGNYRMVVTVKDLVSGKQTMKTTMIRFIE